MSQFENSAPLLSQEGWREAPGWFQSEILQIADLEPPVAGLPTPFRSEREPQLSLELSNVVGLTCNLPKHGRVRDVETGCVHSRMICDVGRIHADLHRLGFTNLECLADVRIQTPITDALDRLLSEIASHTRLRVLQDNHRGAGRSHLSNRGIIGIGECNSSDGTEVAERLVRSRI